MRGDITYDVESWTCSNDRVVLVVRWCVTTTDVSRRKRDCG